MNKQECFLLVDPIESLDRSSHNRDVQVFINNFLDEHSVKFEKGFALKESQLRNRLGYKIEIVLKLITAALLNAIKASRLARTYNVTVFNPNDDPISLYIFQAVRKVLRSNFKIKSRFICTRDRILVTQNFLMINYLKKQISKSIRKVDKLSAETKNYSEFLSGELRIGVEFVPYPPIDIASATFSNEEHNNNLYVALGAARKDKGFDEILSWINLISQKNQNAQFMIQQASKKWPGYEENLQKLSSKDNVKILPSFIDSATQYEILSSAFAILCPYDRVTYQFRGSAIARRAMYLGKLVCAPTGTSLSSDAENQDLLIFPHGPINEKKTQQSHRTRRELGLRLQKESLEAWKRFLL